MIVTDSEKRTAEICADWRTGGLSIAFVPTMGALHRGHESLVQLAAASADRVVVSIFVNPAQFGPNEDLDNYPRTLEQDCNTVKKLGASLVFTPKADVVYHSGFSTLVSVSHLTEGLCGAFRRDHFDGVTTVCAVLFGIVRPDRAVFGMKDAQQLAVIKRMVSDLRMGIEIIAAPIVREPDGLALSSRNQYLSSEERQQASVISTALRNASDLALAGEKSCEMIRNAFLVTLEHSHLLRVQYVETVDPETMIGIETIGKRVLLAVAVFAGKTRLIDNILIESEV